MKSAGVVLMKTFLRVCQGGGEHKDSAMKITNSLINIRAITAHFQPRIEAWLAAQQLSTPSEVWRLFFWVVGRGSAAILYLMTGRGYSLPRLPHLFFPLKERYLYGVPVFLMV